MISFETDSPETSEAPVATPELVAFLRERMAQAERDAAEGNMISLDELMAELTARFTTKAAE